MSSLVVPGLTMCSPDYDQAVNMVFFSAQMFTISVIILSTAMGWAFDECWNRPGSDCFLQQTPAKTHVDTHTLELD